MEQEFLQMFFSDGTDEYRRPMEPEAGEMVQIRLRTPVQVPVSCVLIADGKRYEMNIVSSDSLFSFFETEIVCADKAFSYYFEIYADTRYYYNGNGISHTHDVYFDFKIMPGFKTPDWAKGAVMYQIFTDRFCNGDRSNDVLTDEYSYIDAPVKRVSNWYALPEQNDIRNFFGGDLAGVYKKLDYLQQLGVEVIYFNPLFVSPSNHKYDTQDYDYIDPHFGVIINDEGELLPSWDTDNSHASRYISRVTDKLNLEASNQYFIKLVEEAHRRGIRVILDGVFNHCGSFNKWLDRQMIYDESNGYEPGAYKVKNSPYNSFFSFKEDKWPNNMSYDGWWGHDTLPKLNYEESPKLVEYILNIARKWVSPPYNVDGWRLDVAADLGFTEEFNHKFWKMFRKAVKEANPEAIILAENYNDSEKWLGGDEWDSIMNYEAFMEPVTWFLTGLEKHSDSFNQGMLNNSEVFRHLMRSNMVKLNTQSLLVAMNQLSNHDHSRFLTRTNRRVGRLATTGPGAASEGINTACMREAIIMQMTWPGAPTLYYGDEAGVCGWTDPDSRRSYPWGREDMMLLEFYREAIRIHRSYQALRTGSVKMFNSAYGTVCYGRFNSSEQFLIIVNNSDDATNVNINVRELGVQDETELVRLVRTGPDGYDFSAERYYTDGGYIGVHIDRCSAIVLKNLPEYLR